jgi:hypothetical protein
MHNIASHISGEGYVSDDGAGLQAAFTSATTVVLTCFGPVLIIETHEGADRSSL